MTDSSDFSTLLAEAQTEISRLKGEIFALHCENEDLRDRLDDDNDGVVDVPPSSSGFSRPVRITDELAEFIKRNFPDEVNGRPIIDEAQLCSPVVLTMIMMNYIKCHQLNRPAGKVVPDQTLKDLFHKDWDTAKVSSVECNCMQLQKLLVRHVLKDGVSEQPIDVARQVELKQYFTQRR